MSKDSVKYANWKVQKSTSLDILECLALNSANLDIQDSHGRTAMHYAADDAKGNHVMTWLVVRKANPDICDTLGRTAADVAMIRGNETGAMAALEGIHDSPGRPAGTSGVNGVSEHRRTNFSRMISLRQENVSESSPMKESLDLGDIITYNDDVVEVTPKATSTSTSITSSNMPSEENNIPKQQKKEKEAAAEEEGSTELPQRPSYAPPPPPQSLPEPWQVFLDVASGDRYYFNPVSGKTTWDFPSS
mmetsp:Transcript_29336/g.37836  ORF Transcript_29336/g.37836 Transcript_29336/m.37836 type:complete len:247 (-) Transcript_29336:82-822(-)